MPRIKRIIVLLVISVFSLTANAQVKSDREHDRLSSVVQSVKTEVTEFTNKDGKNVEGPRMPVQTITYDARGNRLKRIDFNRDGSIAQTLTYTYDAEGRSTGYEDYAAGLTAPRKHIYVLDQQGKRTEYRIVQPTGSAGDEKYLYKYDAKNNRIEEALYHKKDLVSRNENTYDDQDRPISTVMYNPDGTVSSRITNSFTPDGKPLERTRYDGDLLTYRVRYTYDGKGRLATLETAGSYVETDSSADGYVTGKVVYAYKDDRVKETVVYNIDGSFRERILYTYDSRGNWTRRTRRVKAATGAKEVPAQIEYRTITYH